MKRVAICLHGDSSNWDLTKESFMKNIIQALDPIIPDVFIHTYVNDNIYILKKKNSNIFKPVSKKVDDYQTYYDICQYEADTRISDHRDYKGTVEVIMQTKKIKMLYEDVSVYESNNGFKYDIIMFSTFNVQYLKPLNIENIKDINNLYLYSFENERDPADKVVIGYRDCIEKTFVSRYDNIYKVNTEYIHIACPTNNLRQLLRYSYVKSGYTDWNWINVSNEAILL